MAYLHYVGDFLIGTPCFGLANVNHLCHTDGRGSRGDEGGGGEGDTLFEEHTPDDAIIYYYCTLVMSATDCTNINCFLFARVLLAFTNILVTFLLRAWCASIPRVF